MKAWPVNAAYAGPKLNQQLDDQARIYLLESPAKNGVDVSGSTVYVSMIFNLYKEDFDGTDAAVGRFIARFYPPGPAKRLLDSGDFALIETPYAWALNSQANTAMRFRVPGLLSGRRRQPRPHATSGRDQGSDAAPAPAARQRRQFADYRRRDYGGLVETGIHIDTTQRGRISAAYRYAADEAALNPLRDELARMIRSARHTTGLPLRCAMTMTITRDNVDAVPDVVRWVVRNADAFHMISFQPLAQVGRTQTDLESVSVAALRKKIAAGLSEAVDGDTDQGVDSGVSHGVD